MEFVAPLGCLMKRQESSETAFINVSVCMKPVLTTTQKGQQVTKKIKGYLFIFSAFREQMHRYFPHIKHSCP